MALIGHDWEKLCVKCLHDKFRDEHFTPVTARTQGDWGIEGFTRTGIIFQCYNPDYENSSSADIYSHQKNKIKRDLEKIEKNQEALKELLIDTKVKEWVFLTEEITNKNLLLDISKLTREYRLKNLDILDENFIVSVQEKSYIENFIKPQYFDEKIDYKSSIEKYDEEFEKSLESNYINYLDMKVKKLFQHLKHEMIVKQQKQQHILNYVSGLDILSSMQKDLPEQYEKFLEVTGNFENNDLVEILYLNEKKTDSEIFKEIKEKLLEVLRKDMNALYRELFIEKLRNYQIAFWLLHCPLTFEER